MYISSLLFFMHKCIQTNSDNFYSGAGVYLCVLGLPFLLNPRVL